MDSNGMLSLKYCGDIISSIRIFGFRAAAGGPPIRFRSMKLKDK